MVARDSTGHQLSGLRPGDPFNPFKLFNGSFIPEAVSRYRGLSPGAKLIYGRLYRYAGEDGSAFPGVPTLAAETGLGETQARGYIKELEAKGFIAVDRENRHYRKDGSGGSNGYVFLWHKAFLGDCGELRKAPPPLRKPEGVPPPKTEPLTPSENRTRRESGFPRGSGKEGHPTSDYQRENRKNRDSHAGDDCAATDRPAEDQSPKPKPLVSEGRRQFTNEERNWMADALNRYGRRRTMSQHMQEDVPPVIVQKCLEAVDGLPLADVGELLRHRCSHGCEPGTGKGPRGWGWFPTVIANAVRAWREQEAAAADPSLKKHLRDYEIKAEPNIEQGSSAFDTLDDIGATA
jgi:hypothetical protein